MNARGPEGGKEAEEGSDREGGLITRPGGTLRFAEEGPGVDPSGRGSRFTSVSGRNGNGKGARPDDESGTAARREKPLNGGARDEPAPETVRARRRAENPGRGCGMEQAREPQGGASRREVEKT